MPLRGFDTLRGFGTTAGIGGRTLEGLASEAPKGFLYNLGRTLDFPGRMVRSGLIGQQDATGWDVLRKLGIRDRPGFFQSQFPFFDPVDVAAFGTEVLLDPLTYLTGGLTKAGQVSSRAGAASKTLQDALSKLKVGKGALRPEQTRFLEQTAKESEGILGKLGQVAPLGETLSEQAKLGQRGLRFMGKPLSGLPGVPLLERGLYGGMTGLGRLVEKAPLGQSLLKRFSHRGFTDTAGQFRRFLPDTEGARFNVDVLRRMEGQAAEDVGAELTPFIEKAREAYAGASPPESLGAFEPFFSRMREGLGMPESTLRETPGRLKAVRFGEKIPEVTRAVEEARRFTEETLEREIAGKTLTHPLQDETVFYLERLLAPEGVRALHKAGKLRAVEKGVRELTAKHGSIYKRKFPGETVDALGKLFEEHGVKRFFELDPTVSVPKRVKRGGIATVNAVHAQSLIDQFGTTNPLEALGGKTALEFAEDVGLDLDKFDGATRTLWGKTWIPRDITEEALASFKKFQLPGEFDRLFKSWRTLASMYRLGMTAFFPAYHARNMLSNFGLNWLGDVQNPKFYLQAAAMQGMPGAENFFPGVENLSDALKEMKRKMDSLGITGRGFVKTVRRETEEAVTGLPKALKLVTPYGTKTGAWLGDKATSVGNWLEENARIAHYLSKKADGLTDMEAAASVKKYLFNYDELTDFEKGPMKNTVFFYTWTRNVIPLLIQQHLESTGKMAAMMRLSAAPSVEREGTPVWMREGISIPEGYSRTGERRFISGLGLPTEEFQKFSIIPREGGVGGFLQRAGEKVANQLLPPLRAPLEVLSGKDFFLQKPIPEADRAYQFLRNPAARELTDILTGPGDLGYKEYTTPGGFKGVRANPETLYAMRNMPPLFGILGPRLLSQLSRASRVGMDREPLLPEALAFLSGIKTQHVDPERLRTDLARERIGELLRQAELQGDAKRFKSFFATGQEGEKDQQVLELLQLLRQSRK